MIGSSPSPLAPPLAPCPLPPPPTHTQHLQPPLPPPFPPRFNISHRGRLNRRQRPTVEVASKEVLNKLLEQDW